MNVTPLPMYSCMRYVTSDSQMIRLCQRMSVRIIQDYDGIEYSTVYHHRSCELAGCKVDIIDRHKIRYKMHVFIEMRPLTIIVPSPRCVPDPR